MIIRRRLPPRSLSSFTNLLFHSLLPIKFLFLILVCYQFWWFSIRTTSLPETSSANQIVVPDNDESLVDFFANNGYAKAFDTMQYPMGLYDAAHQTTYIAYQGPHEDPYVVAYDHIQRLWKGPVHAGVSLLGHTPDPVQMHDGRVTSKSLARLGLGGKEAHSRFAADNHGKPAIVMDDVGYLHLSYGAHGGDLNLKNELGKNQFGDYSAGRQIHLKSRTPYDISAWDVMNSSLSWNGCYAQFVKIGSDIYHFVRHGAHVSCWTYQRSVDQGASWGPIQPIVQTKQQEKERVKDSWYCRFRAGTSRSHILQALCVYHKHWMPPKHNLEAYNGYYLELDTKIQTWHNVQGQKLDLPLTKERADELIKVFDTEQSPEFPYMYTHPGSVAMDDQGRPHLLYKIAVGGDMEGLRVGRGQRKMFYTGWTGTAWTHPVPVSGYNSTDFDEDGDLLIHGNHIEVVFAVANKVVSYDSYDLGHTWQRGKTMMAREGPGSMRTSAFFLNGHPDARLAAYMLEPNQNKVGAYRKLFLVGNDGPVLRMAREADICRGRLVGDKGSECVPSNLEGSPAVQ